jgi:hypothetical protein
MDMHFARILMAPFSTTGVQPGSKVFSLVEFFQSPCADFGFALTQKVMLVTFVPVTKEITMKIPSLFLLVALVLPMTPALVHAQGAPAMPLVVCHVDQAPQMLVPAYLCQWHDGSQHP